MDNQYLYTDLFGTTREKKCKLETESYMFSSYTLQKFMGHVSAIVQSCPQVSIMITKGPKQSKRVKEGPKWSNWYKLVQTDPKLPKMIQKKFKIAQNCPNWSKVVLTSAYGPKATQSGPSWSRTVPSGKKLAKMVKFCQIF